MHAALLPRLRPVLQVPRKVPQVLQRRRELAKQNQHQHALPHATVAQGTGVDTCQARPCRPAELACVFKHMGRRSMSGLHA